MSENLIDLLKFQRLPVAMEAALGGTPFAYIPDGYTQATLEDCLALPIRKRANIQLDDAASFSTYVNLHKKSSSVLYAKIKIQEQVLNVMGIMDDHEFNVQQEQKDAPPNTVIGDAAWREHVVQFTPPKTLEWLKWNLHNKKSMSQLEFAAFIEDNLPDIQAVAGSPSGADMLKMALGFEQTSDAKFSSKLNNQSGGVTMEFISTDDKATVSRMEVFNRFTLGLKVFLNGHAYPLEARLKYRASGGSVSFWYELVRPDRVFNTACETTLNAIQEQTALTLLFGQANV